MFIDGKKIITYALVIAFLISAFLLSKALIEISGFTLPTYTQEVPQIRVSMNGEPWGNGTSLPIYGNFGDNTVSVTVSNVGEVPFTFTFLPHTPEGWNVNVQFSSATVEPHSTVNGTIVVTVPNLNNLDFNWICEIRVEAL
jgi:hypothetical protein